MTDLEDDFYENSAESEAVQHRKREYFFDVVERAPTLDDCLQHLAKQPVMTAWRAGPKQGIFNLNGDELDMLVNAERVDWDGFHTHYLMQLSKCVLKSNSINSAIDQEHVLVNNEEAFSNELKIEYPTEEIENDDKKALQWRGAIVALSTTFCSFIRTRLDCGGGPSLAERVKEILRKDLDHSNAMHEETMYYIAGAMLKVLQNLAKKCDNKYKPVLKDIIENACSTKEDAMQMSLPIRKVTEQRNDDKLLYVNEEFFVIVQKVESVFEDLLSVKSVKRYGVEIVRDIAHALCKEDVGFSSLMSKVANEDLLREVVRRFLRSYGNLRGKDFVRKLNARRYGPKEETLRAAIGARHGYTKNTKKDSTTQALNATGEPQSRFVRMYVPALKEELRKRKLKVGGNKADLIERLEEFEKKQKETLKDATPLTGAYDPVEDWKTAELLANFEMVLDDEQVQEYIFYEELQEYEEYGEEETEKLQDELANEYCEYSP
eukprot:scaffold18176_cov75-Skeletonema_dohrnii-CCMP3373.AAC.2